MTEPKSKVETIDLIGGALAIDFVNTVGNRKGEDLSNHLSTYADLVAWSRHAYILTAQAADALLKQAQRRPAEAEQVHAHALALREAIYHILYATLMPHRPSAGDLATLNEVLAAGLSHGQIVLTENGYAWDWKGDAGSLSQMLYPIARSAAELVTSDSLARLRECEGDDCGWLFLDTSKNHSRRWCSMGDCGNRAKARRHYDRVRGK